MKKVDCSVKYRFVALLLLLGILNKRISFAAAQHNVRSESSEQNQRYRCRDDHKSPEDYFNIRDNTLAFEMLHYTHQIPDNFSLIQKEGQGVVLVVGPMGVGKTTLVNGFAGGVLFYDKESQQIKVKPTENTGKMRENREQSVSCTKMPNILLSQKNDWFDQEKNWIFVDCPGFDDNTEEQKLFIKASVQIIVRNIKTLKAILFVIDKQGLNKCMTNFHGMRAHSLSKLVVYLQALLVDPFDFYQQNLFLVINRTGGEYQEKSAIKILEAHCHSLMNIQQHYNDNDWQAEWKQHGGPVLRFINIFLHGSYGKNQIICMNNLTNEHCFKEAIAKIKETGGIVKNHDIKIALSLREQEDLIKVILRTGHLASLNYTYKSCKKKLYDDAHAKHRQKKADGKKLKKRAEDKYKAFEKSKNLQIIRCVSYVFIAVVYLVSKLKSNGNITIREIFVGVILVLLASIDHLSGPSEAPFRQALQEATTFGKNIKFEPPSEQAIKDAVRLTDEFKYVMGRNREREEFYYQLTLLGKKLEENTALQIFREKFELKFNSI